MRSEMWGVHKRINWEWQVALRVGALDAFWRIILAFRWVEGPASTPFLVARRYQHVSSLIETQGVHGNYPKAAEGAVRESEGHLQNASRPPSRRKSNAPQYSGALDHSFVSLDIIRVSVACHTMCDKRTEEFVGGSDAMRGHDADGATAPVPVSTMPSTTRPTVSSRRFAKRNAERGSPHRSFMVFEWRMQVMRSAVDAPPP
jgi:hypothetical protein